MSIPAHFAADALSYAIALGVFDVACTKLDPPAGGAFAGELGERVALAFMAEADRRRKPNRTHFSIPRNWPSLPLTGRWLGSRLAGYRWRSEMCSLALWRLPSATTTGWPMHMRISRLKHWRGHEALIN